MFQGNFCTCVTGNYKIIWDNTYSSFFKKVREILQKFTHPFVELVFIGFLNITDLAVQTGLHTLRGGGTASVNCRGRSIRTGLIYFFYDSFV